MNELAALGVILLLALLAGHVVKYFRVPEVTGYILAGVLLGPAGIALITHDALQSLQVFSEVALGLILFSIGAVFELVRFRRIGRRVATLTAVESLLAATFVTGGLLVAGQPLIVALLLGVIAMETAAASTLMVMRECNAEGPLAETLSGIIALNNIFCLTGFLIVAAGFDLHRETLQAGIGWDAVYRSLYPLLWQLAGSAALGFIVGVVLATWAAQVAEHGEMLILLVGAILLAVGVAQLLELSPLLATLAVGATMVNLSSESRRIFDALAQTDPPLYAIFFVIAGADLNVGLLPSLGVVGLIYVLGRAGGKLFGTIVATRRVKSEPPVRRYLGFAMLSQAGLAVGLLLAVNRRFPELAPLITTVVLAAVTIFELVGPVGARYALVRAGEAKPQPPATGLID
ncbi:MAG TPA: cation:proton antiporter [Gemmatimonadales bacterium]|nr:cation:proton antiporter [Gemmatimonadales bacterium]